MCLWPEAVCVCCCCRRRLCEPHAVPIFIYECFSGSVKGHCSAWQKTVCCEQCEEQKLIWRNGRQYNERRTGGWSGSPRKSISWTCQHSEQTLPFKQPPLLSQTKKGQGFGEILWWALQPKYTESPVEMGHAGDLSQRHNALEKEKL